MLVFRLNVKIQKQLLQFLPTFEPDRAIVPKLEINSSLVIPNPVSWNKK